MAVQANWLKSFSNLTETCSGMVQPVWYEKWCRAAEFGVIFVQIVYGKGVLCDH